MLNRDKGMSMIELLVVILAITVISATALPQLMDARESYRLTAEASDLITRLSNARIMAITRNADFRIAVTSSTAYAIQQETAPNTWAAIESFTMPTGYTITTTGSAEFHSRGNATPTGTYTITNSNSETRDVVVTTAGRAYAQ